MDACLPSGPAGGRRQRYVSARQRQPPRWMGRWTEPSVRSEGREGATGTGTQPGPAQHGTRHHPEHHQPRPDPNTSVATVRQGHSPSLPAASAWSYGLTLPLRLGPRPFAAPDKEPRPPSQAEKQGAPRGPGRAPAGSREGRLRRSPSRGKSGTEAGAQAHGEPTLGVHSRRRAWGPQPKARLPVTLGRRLGGGEASA